MLMMESGDNLSVGVRSMRIVQEDLLCLRLVRGKHVILFNSLSQLVYSDWKEMKNKH
jgi:hypothetical protein